MDFMYKSINVVVRDAPRKRVEVSSSRSISTSLSVFINSASLFLDLDKTRLFYFIFGETILT